MTQRPTVFENGYLGMNKGSWLQLFPPNHAPGSYPYSNWKFHINVAPEHLAQAWHIVAETLMNDTGHHMAKVVPQTRLNEVTDKNNDLCGKMMTVYASTASTPADYMQLCRNIEKRFQAAGIAPGDHQVQGDRHVPGSRYLSYRNDGGQDKAHHHSAASLRNLPEHQRYNPNGAADPFMNFTIDPPACPALGTWLPATVASGGLVARIAVEAEHIPTYMAALQQQGYAPVIHESATLGTTIRLSGQDAAKVLCAQQNLFDTLRPQDWQDAMAQNGTVITRIATNSPGQHAHVMRQLTQLGLTPSEHLSSTMGQTVRLTGADAVFLDTLRQNHQHAQADAPLYAQAQALHAQAQTQPSMSQNFSGSRPKPA